MMKNVQVIDSAENCTYDIYALTEFEFNVIFPQEGQQIEFIELLLSRAESEDQTVEVKKILEDMWERYIEKESVSGIHGTLFFGKNELYSYFPSKKWDVSFSDL